MTLLRVGMHSTNNYLLTEVRKHGSSFEEKRKGKAIFTMKLVAAIQGTFHFSSNKSELRV